MTYRLKHLVTNPVVKAQVSSSGRIDLEDIASGDADLTSSEDVRGRRTGEGVVFEDGDVLFGKLRPYLRKSLLAPGYGLCSPELLVLRADRSRLEPRFLHHIVRSDPFVAWANATSKGTKMPRTDFEAVSQYVVDLPTLDEQRRIADFLDTEVFRIESRVRATHRIERLTRERDRALVHAEVTGRSLSGSKESTQVPWLGALPARWKTMRLRHCVHVIKTGSTPPTAEDRYYAEGSIPWFGPAAFGNSLSLGDPSRLIHPTAQAEGVAPVLPDGSTLVVTIGATTGRVAQLEQPGSCNQQISALVPNASVSPRFLAWHLKALEGALKGLASVTTLPILGRESLGNVRIALPPMQQQERIVGRIDDHAGRGASTRRLLGRQIELLRERRDALITAAVTGGLDPSTHNASAVTA